MRVIDTGWNSAGWNITVDSVLLEMMSRGEIPPTFRFLSFNPSCVLVGYHQCVTQEVRVGFCEEGGIEINRRITGGGTVFFDPSQLGWEIVALRDDPVFPSKPEDLYRVFGEAFACGLRLLGIPARYKPRNDIEVEGRKISGTGGITLGNAFLFQGTLLVKDEIETMLKALMVPVEKLRRKEIASLRERVTCVERELGRVPSRDEFKNAILAGFKEVLGLTFEQGKLTRKEVQRINSACEYFLSNDWVHKIEYPEGTQGMLNYTHRRKGGIVRVSMIVNAVDKILRSTMIYGDFFISPPAVLMDLERLLKNIRMEPKGIEDIVERFFAEREEEMEIVGLSKEDFLSGVRGVLGKWELLSKGFSIGEADAIFQVLGSIDDIKSLEPRWFLLPYCAKGPCDWRYSEDCTQCGGCEVGDVYKELKALGYIPYTIVSFEHLMETLSRLKANGESAFVGSCCEAFYSKHQEDFERAGLPGVLVDIKDKTCYDLGKVREAYRGDFDVKTSLNTELISKVAKFLRES